MSEPRFRRRLEIVLSAALTLAPVFSLAAQPAFSSRGESSFQVFELNGETRVDKTETHFAYENWPDMKQDQVYKAAQKSSFWTSREGLEQTTSITAYGSDKGLFDRVVWEASEKGIDFKILASRDFVSVTEYGCCGAPDITRLLDRRTGKKVEEILNRSLITFGILNSKIPSRYLAVAADSQAPSTRKGRTHAGTISYFDGSRIKARARLYVSTPKSWHIEIGQTAPISPVKDDPSDGTVWLPDVATTDPVKAYGDIGMNGKISLPDGPAAFRIMVNGDTIDFAASSAAPEIELVAVP